MPPFPVPPPHPYKGSSLPHSLLPPSLPFAFLPNFQLPAPRLYSPSAALSNTQFLKKTPGMENWEPSYSSSSRFAAGSRNQGLRGGGGVLFRADGDRDAIGGESTAFSKPVAVLEFAWNLAFVVVLAVVLLSTLEERPCTPLRLWVFGYGLQCMAHVVLVYVDYRSHWEDDDVGFLSGVDRNRMFKRLESANTLFSSAWWALGFYWTAIGGQLLIQDSPRLYWLTVIFLAFDVFLMIFSIVLACLVFLAMFCCIPLLAIAYAVTSAEGASAEMIKSLPKYIYRSFDSGKSFDMKSPVFGLTRDQGILVLPPEDSECCICLQTYVDGAVVSSLHCNHHFHSECIGRWLIINAVCPLCKFSIHRRDTLV
ncbi:hypothetical protein MLD38_028841 [Melastoma candidum]|uniref:Uncharacterized protein n=1 Tax=Melastoma candidum TaxID=119954 RepID=A0ACB9N296_9MYRT|nr:hypothetical protein MLD38_028841 [Melastoma candidum]